MSSFTTRIMLRASADLQTIVLPEGDDPRTIEAAVQAQKLGIARVILLASEATIQSCSADLEGITVIDPATWPERQRYADVLYELRQAKGMTTEQAWQLAANVLYCGALMVYLGQADGMVAGAAHATSDVLRPSLQILKTAPGAKLVSAFFVIVVPDCSYGENGTFVFADSGLVENPSAEELANIAISSAASFAALVEAEPVVAMLSYSTLGSASSPLVEKVQQATAIARDLAPELKLDGEFQLDAAIVPAIGASKAPGHELAGQANVLIFPDLNSGNIAYKLAQRLAKAEAYGPITQGMAKPVNDLSRGASAEDITGVIAITAVQSQARKAIMESNR
ncbi:MAG: phosphate acetyltransferase [Coriobacteriales bacterium]|jgi:phosphate acetyltransferase|nr:phosphate acetyltransferase [Coriobacteriales bacterium]